MRWICDSCGQTGVTRFEATTDEVLCPTCGEPVVPDEL
jgi:uncharacterized Zn finger protein (UPF0148 family)